MDRRVRVLWVSLLSGGLLIPANKPLLMKPFPGSSSASLFACQAVIAPFVSQRRGGEPRKAALETLHAIVPRDAKVDFVTPLSDVPGWVSSHLEPEILQLWEALETPHAKEIAARLMAREEVAWIRFISLRPEQEITNSESQRMIVRRWVNTLLGALLDGSNPLDWENRIFEDFIFILLENVVQHVLREGHRAAVIAIRSGGTPRLNSDQWVYVVDGGPGMVPTDVFRHHIHGPGSDRNQGLESLQLNAHLPGLSGVFWSGPETYSLSHFSFHKTPLSPPGTLAALYRSSGYHLRTIQRQHPRSGDPQRISFDSAA